MIRETPELQLLDDGMEGFPSNSGTPLPLDRHCGDKAPKARLDPSGDPVADLRSYLSKIDR